MPPDDDTLRATLGLSAIAGGAVLGLYRISILFVAGQPVQVRDWLVVGFNVAAAAIAGFLVAYFVGPALAPLIPLEGLREPHAMGFGIGALAWEVIPAALRATKGFADRKAKEIAP